MYTILFRPSLAEESELETAKEYFPVITQRAKVGSAANGQTIIGRYSVLPYYKELEEDIKELGGSLINSHKQHKYVADLANWYPDLEDLTPKTWFSLESTPQTTEHGFVLKGETNSKKFQWNTHMYAADKRAAGSVYSKLSQDSMIGDQNIYVRNYVPLVTLEYGLNGLPITEEYRFFILDRKIVGSSFYWASHVDDLTQIPDVSSVPGTFMDLVISRIGDNCRFYVVDVAKTQTGEWIVIELNDAQMSGLSLIEPKTLYSNMKNVLYSP